MAKQAQKTGDGQSIPESKRRADIGQKLKVSELWHFTEGHTETRTRR
jgi:hypothetical protein